jgi:fluoride exporter
VRLASQILLVAFGSALGGLLRWGVGVWLGRALGSAFPVGTFVINITGSLFLGWFMTWIGQRGFGSQAAWISADDLRLMVAVGFTGAYTTFSTFEYETHQLLGDGDWLTGAAYVALSVFLGLLAVRLGVILAGGR